MSMPFSQHQPMWQSHVRRQEDDLVRQLLEADDIDAVLARVENDHYKHIGPVIQRLSAFDGTPTSRTPPPPPSTSYAPHSQARSASSPISPGMPTTSRRTPPLMSFASPANAGLAPPPPSSPRGANVSVAGASTRTPPPPPPSPPFGSSGYNPFNSSLATPVVTPNVNQPGGRMNDYSGYPNNAQSMRGGGGGGGRHRPPPPPPLGSPDDARGGDASTLTPESIPAAPGYARDGAGCRYIDPLADSTQQPQPLPSSVEHSRRVSLVSPVPLTSPLETPDAGAETQQQAPLPRPFSLSARGDGLYNTSAFSSTSPSGYPSGRGGFPPPPPPAAPSSPSAATSAIGRRPFNAFTGRGADSPPQRGLLADSPKATPPAPYHPSALPLVTTRTRSPEMGEGAALEDTSQSRIARQLQLLRNYRELAELCAATDNPSVNLFNALPPEQLARMQAEQLQNLSGTPVTVNNNYFFSPVSPDKRHGGHHQPPQPAHPHGEHSSPSARRAFTPHSRSRMPSTAEADPGAMSGKPSLIAFGDAAAPAGAASQFQQGHPSLREHRASLSSPSVSTFPRGPLQSPGASSSSPDSPMATPPLSSPPMPSHTIIPSPLSPTAASANALAPPGTSPLTAPSPNTMSRSVRAKSHRFHRSGTGLDEVHTPTATTEEAGTSHDQDEEEEGDGFEGDSLGDEEEDGEELFRQPRIIEHAQHRRATPYTTNVSATQNGTLPTQLAVPGDPMAVQPFSSLGMGGAGGAISGAMPSTGGTSGGLVMGGGAVDGNRRTGSLGHINVLSGKEELVADAVYNGSAVSRPNSPGNPHPSPMSYDTNNSNANSDAAAMAAGTTVNGGGGGVAANGMGSVGAGGAMPSYYNGVVSAEDNDGRPNATSGVNGGVGGGQGTHRRSSTFSANAHSAGQLMADGRGGSLGGGGPVHRRSLSAGPSPLRSGPDRTSAPVPARFHNVGGDEDDDGIDPDPHTQSTATPNQRIPSKGRRRRSGAASGGGDGRSHRRRNRGAHAEAKAKHGTSPEEGLESSQQSLQSDEPGNTTNSTQVNKSGTGSKQTPERFIAPGAAAGGAPSGSGGGGLVSAESRARRHLSSDSGDSEDSGDDGPGDPQLQTNYPRSRHPRPTHGKASDGEDKKRRERRDAKQPVPSKTDSDGKARSGKGDGAGRRKRGEKKRSSRHHHSRYADHSHEVPEDADNESHSGGSDSTSDGSYSYSYSYTSICTESTHATSFFSPGTPRRNAQRAGATPRARSRSTDGLRSPARRALSAGPRGRGRGRGRGQPPPPPSMEPLRQSAATPRGRGRPGGRGAMAGRGRASPYSANGSPQRRRGPPPPSPSSSPYAREGRPQQRRPPLSQEEEEEAYRYPQSSGGGGGGGVPRQRGRGAGRGGARGGRGRVVQLPDGRTIRVDGSGAPARPPDAMMSGAGGGSGVRSYNTSPMRRPPPSAMTSQLNPPQTTAPYAAPSTPQNESLAPYGATALAGYPPGPLSPRQMERLHQPSPGDPNAMPVLGGGSGGVVAAPPQAHPETVMMQATVGSTQRPPASAAAVSVRSAIHPSPSVSPRGTSNTVSGGTARLNPGLLYGSLLPKARPETAMVMVTDDRTGRVRGASVNQRSGNIMSTDGGAAHPMLIGGTQPAPDMFPPAEPSAVASTSGAAAEVQQLVWKSGSSGFVVGRNNRIPAQPKAKLTSHYRTPTTATTPLANGASANTTMMTAGGAAPMQSMLSQLRTSPPPAQLPQSIMMANTSSEQLQQPRPTSPRVAFGGAASAVPVHPRFIQPSSSYGTVSPASQPTAAFASTNTPAPVQNENNGGGATYYSGGGGGYTVGRKPSTTGATATTNTAAQRFGIKALNAP